MRNARARPASPRDPPLARGARAVPGARRRGCRCGALSAWSARRRGCRPSGSSPTSTARPRSPSTSLPRCCCRISRPLPSSRPCSRFCACEASPRRERTACWRARLSPASAPCCCICSTAWPPIAWRSCSPCPERCWGRATALWRSCGARRSPAFPVPRRQAAASRSSWGAVPWPLSRRRWGRTRFCWGRRWRWPSRLRSASCLRPAGATSSNCRPLRRGSVPRMCASGRRWAVSDSCSR